MTHEEFQRGLKEQSDLERLQKLLDERRRTVRRLPKIERAGEILYRVLFGKAELPPDEKWAFRLVELTDPQEREAVWKRVRAAFDSAPADTQSPIERAMLAALLVEASADGVKIRRGTNGSLLFDDDGSRLDIFVQKPIQKYFADFLLVPAIGRSLVVECDGHEFHEKTREQASHDKKRDREFQKEGHGVFRFTGADIWNDPFACAREAVQYIHA